ncbi:hypothetical protein [Streptomyces sp. NPDC054794]
MTSATTTVRIAAAAAGLVGALALTACSSGGDSKDDSSASPSASAAPTSTAGSGGTGGRGSSAGKLQGSWLTTTDGKAVALVITGKQAALFGTGGTVCSGSAGAEAGMQMIHLKCADGSKDRATGMVDSVSGSTMKVTWSSGKLGKETYTKAEGGKLPPGLPTASLGAQ